MRRIFRILILVYALALMAQTIGSLIATGELSWASIRAEWLTGAVAVTYLVMAAGFLLCKDGKELSRRWLGIIACVMFSQSAFFINGGEGDESGTTLYWFLTGFPTMIILMAAYGWVYLKFRVGEKACERSAYRMSAFGSLIAGFGMVLASLFLRLSDPGTGWEILQTKEEWITQKYNVAKSLYGTSAGWMLNLYGPGGYFIYAVSLLAVVGMVVWLIAMRISAERMQASRWTARIAVVFAFCGFWMYTDIFWGWNYLQNQSNWTACLGSALWLAAPLAVLVFLIPVMRKPSETWRLRTLSLLQFPVAAFNFAMLWMYFGSEALVHVPGLGALLVGLQLINWGCLVLLMPGAVDRVEEKS